MRSPSHRPLWACSLTVVGICMWMASGAGLAAETARGTSVTEGGHAPTLWLLAIGVSNYKDPGLHLRYAAADAEAIAKVFAQQKTSGYYRDVKTRVLINENVTRESVLKSFYSGFLGQAAPSDIVVIFMAGHGKQAYNEYYFLPYPATQDNDSLLADAIAKSDFNKAFYVLRENGVKSIVVMLDTCEAAALSRGARGKPGAAQTKDIVADMAAAEGMYVLASSKSQQESLEDAKWKHGAFTFAALEGLRGSADLNRDGELEVNELFGYVANQVPELTKGRQHPSQDMKGTRLVLAAVPTITGKADPTPPSSEEPTPRGSGKVDPNSIFVLPFEDLSNNPADRQANQFTGKAIQAEFTNRLSKVKALTVRAAYSVVIDDPQSPLPTLRDHGIGKAVAGSFVYYGQKVVLRAWVVDTVTGQQLPLGDVEDVKDDEVIFRLQTKLIQQTLVELNVAPSATEAVAVEKVTNNSLSALEQLMQAEGATVEVKPADDKPPTPASGKPRATLDAPWRDVLRWLHDQLVPAAHAEEEGQDQIKGEIKQVLNEYMRAYQDKDLDSLAKLYVSFPPSQGEALRAYLSNANDLSVELDEVNVLEAQADTASVSYTRRDHFTEKATGKQINLEVRLKKSFVRVEGKWKFAGG